MDGSGGNSTSSNGSNNITRWNPTKEQISILEGLYGQGMRTPTADQIQRITLRLRAYGHIEGKNVFYWFQNHKARQRQKEKEMQQQQQHQSCLSFAYMNRRCLYFPNRNSAAPGLLHHPAPSPSSTTNVVFRPYYVAQNEMAGDNYAPYPEVLLPSGSNRRPRVAADDDDPADIAETTMTMVTQDCGRCLVATTAMAALENNDKSTLDLFPVHPSGFENGPRLNNSANEDYSAYTEKCGGDLRDRPFFDFFSVNGCCEQD